MPPAPKKVSAQPPPVWSVVSTLRAVVSQVQTASGIGDLVVWSVGAGGKLGQQ